MATNGELYSRELLDESDEWTVAERSQIIRAGNLTDRIESLSDLLTDKTMTARYRVDLAKVIANSENALHRIEHELRQGAKARAKNRGSHPAGPWVAPEIREALDARHAEWHAADPEAADPDGAPERDLFADPRCPPQRPPAPLDPADPPPTRPDRPAPAYGAAGHPRAPLTPERIERARRRNRLGVPSDAPDFSF